MINIKEIMHNSFPEYLRNDIKIITDKILIQSKRDQLQTFSVIVENDILHIPARIYSEEVRKEESNQLSKTQQAIINCLYTRHYNGFIRENNLKSVVTLNYPWVIPYVINLLGEYVIEIIEVVFDNINNLDKENYKTFIMNNQKYFQTIESRVISYWDCYYRREFPNKDEYIGLKVVNYFKHLLK